MSESEKMALFVNQDLGDKDVTKIPGIGEAYANSLRVHGYIKAYQLVGKYLILNKDEAMFKRWLNYKCEAHKDHQDLCYVALKDWGVQFVQ